MRTVCRMYPEPDLYKKSNFLGGSVYNIMVLWLFLFSKNETHSYYHIPLKNKGVNLGSDDDATII